ncbi:MAG: protein translocase subunit SecD, partial [Calditrichia bacterium]|nr:protein translocase subunit SecD [Calditrichia bacterium]
KQSFLDSVWNEPVYNLLGIEYSYKDIKNKAIKLGLDLQGGMHVVLEVDVKTLLYKIAKTKDAVLEKSLNNAEITAIEEDEEILPIFIKNLRKENKELVDYYGTTSMREHDKIIEYLRKQIDGVIDRSLQVLENRVDEFGVSEPIIHKQGKHRIVIELAGITDPQRIRNLIGQTAMLEFKMLRDPEICSVVYEKLIKLYMGEQDSLFADKVEDEDKIEDSKIAEADKEEEKVTTDELFGEVEKDTLKVADTKEQTQVEPLFLGDPRQPQTVILPKAKVNQFKRFIERKDVQNIIEEIAGRSQLLMSAKLNRYDNFDFYTVYLVNEEAELTGNTIEDANPMSANLSDATGFGSYQVSFNLDSEGAKQFARTTGANVNKRLAIVLDNKIYSAPNIRNKIPNGRASIDGMASLEEARDLSIVLKAGSLPTPVTIIEERTVGPSLGKDSIEKGSMSIMIGFLLVIIFMLFYYKIGGIIADFALVFNMLIIMGVMGYFHATLTLPGIAGLILTIGMAVDANVLVFERIREELRKGKTPK